MTHEELLAACRAAMPGVEWTSTGHLVLARTALFGFRVGKDADGTWYWSLSRITFSGGSFAGDFAATAQAAIDALAAAVDEAAAQLARVRRG